MLRYYPLLPGALPWWLRYLLYTTTPFRNGGPSCAALASLRGQSCHTSHQASRLDFSDVKERTALQDFHFNYFLSWMNVTKPITLIAHFAGKITFMIHEYWIEFPGWLLHSPKILVKSNRYCCNFGCFDLTNFLNLTQFWQNISSV